jgi:glycosyltransferase involved in cell wall biosynthesis
VSERIKNWYRIKYAQTALMRADRVIAISGFVRDFLVSHYDIPSHKIGIVYHGLDLAKRQKFSPSVAIPSHWQNKFLFTAGSIRPARGLEDIFHAMLHMKKRHLEIPNIIIGGSPDPVMMRYQKKLMAWLDKNDLSSSILWAGYLHDNEMSWCYEHCLAFIMTSRVESFGMIAGEAMAHGCVCISSDNPCLPEIFASSALYYPSGDYATLAKQIQSALSMGQAERAAMSSAAKDIASRFSWEICAQKTVDELQKAIR